MNEEEIKERLDRIKDLVILSNTRLNYLKQLSDLILEKNRIVLGSQGFYTMVLRDFNGSLVSAIRALIENRKDTHNINRLIDAMRIWVTRNVEKEKNNQLEVLFVELSQIVNEEVAKRARVIASSSFTHLSIKKPKKPVAITYGELEIYLHRVGTLLNKISGTLWDASTVLYIFESDGDSFKKGLQHLERAEQIGSMLLLMDPENEVIKRANDLFDKRDKAK